MLEAGFCAEALARGSPEVFNTDQDSQFASREFARVLQDRGVKISMDAEGRYTDNIFVKRLWRTVKYQKVCLRAYADATEARMELGACFELYNDQSPHQGLCYGTPAGVFYKTMNAPGEESKEKRNSPEQVLVSLPGAPRLPLDASSFMPTNQVHFRPRWTQ